MGKLQTAGLDSIPVRPRGIRAHSSGAPSQGGSELSTLQYWDVENQATRGAGGSGSSETLLGNREKAGEFRKGRWVDLFWARERGASGTPRHWEEAGHLSGQQTPLRASSRQRLKTAVTTVLRGNRVYWVCRVRSGPEFRRSPPHS